MSSFMLDASNVNHFTVNSVTSEILDNIKSKNDDILNQISCFDDDIEDPYAIIECYFKGKKLDRLVRHQIESYNHFINYQIEKTIEMFNPVIIRSENDYIKETDKYTLEININFDNFKLYSPQIHENNGATKTMLPQEAKLRNFTYASIMTVDVNIK